MSFTPPKKTGAPAYPRPGFELESHQSGADTRPQEGMTLRDAIAIGALQGIIAGEGEYLTGCDLAARRAYELADAMLIAREV